MTHTQTQEPKFSLEDENFGGGSELDSVAGELIDSAPPVSEFAIEAENNKNSEEESEAEKDVDGVSFDPAIHTGSKLKNGRWRTRKAPKAILDPRKKNPQPVTVDALTGEIDNSQAMSDEEIKLAAQSAAASIFLLGMICGGDEWQPVGDDGKPLEPINERKLMETAFIDYFRAKGITKLPPSTTLMIALGSYAIPRFFMPKTKERVSNAKTWIALRFTKWKIKREFKKRGIEANISIKDGEILINGTRANSWNDGKRENDVRATTGDKVQK